MGKTTLVQTMCEHDEVVKDFKIIWVTVSTGFDATSVTRKILESIDRETLKIESLEPLQQALKDKLKSFNKFLLILDDVWEDEKRNEWEILFAPLRATQNRSKILLTTRMESVAAMAANVMGVAREDLTLEELREDDNLELFNHHVFSGLNSQDYSELKVIGKKIARKLKGCPLVTKVVSGHLKGNMTSEFWDRFLCEGDLNDFKGNSDDIMKVLRLSYYYLPTELQTCFRYCSIFPQDYNFTRRELILLWIGSGLIPFRENESKRHEEIAESYLFQLSSKSFFDRKIEKDKFLGLEEEYYVMHDLMHELSEYVSSGECKRITSPDMFGDVKDTIRHLHIEKAHEQNFDNFEKIIHFKNLRTLVISGGGYSSKQMRCIIDKTLQNSRALRLIEINSPGIFKFPRKTSNLKHLRSAYVDTLAPEGLHVVHKLYHLLFLGCDFLSHGQADTKRVRDLGSLGRLRCVPYDTFGQFPVSRLTCLQELTGYRVQGSKGNRIGDIGNLKYLRELEVKDLHNIDNSDEARNAKLKEKKHLTLLSLGWSASSSGTQNRIDDLVLDQLEPPANIRELTINGYEGQRPPFWICNLTVKNLVSLTLEGCINLEHLPSLEEFVLLRRLTLHKLPKLQQIGRSSLVSSSSSIKSYLPPNLYSLIVRECPELWELPVLPTSLAYLKLIFVGLTSLPMIGKLHSEDVDGQQSCLIDIRWLTIRNCVRLESVCLPFERMSKLQSLQIIVCPEARTLGGSADVILPSSLATLSIGRCGELELPLLRSLQCLTNLSDLELIRCPGLVSLPSAEVCGKNLKSLRTLEIRGCDNLISLGGLGSLPSLHRLSIQQCCKLVEAARSSLTGYASAGEEEHLALPRLEELEVDSTTLLLVQPLKSLRHTRQLVVGVASEAEVLPEHWLLQNRASLTVMEISKAGSPPLSMRDLSSLQILILYGAGELQSLPDLPLSLRHLRIEPCHPDLEMKIGCRGSPEWHKISPVQKVEIGTRNGKIRYFILGKECSIWTYFDLRGQDFDTLASWANQEPKLHWWKKQCCSV